MITPPAVQNNSEFEQSVLRIVFSVIIFVYSFTSSNHSASNIHHVDVSDITVIYSEIFMAIAFLYAIFVYFSPKQWGVRHVFAINLDIWSATFAMWSTGESGLFFYGIYLWVIVGNGFRFGIKPLFISYIMSIVGFIFVIQNNSYWREHNISASALLLILLTIPVYVYKLVQRMNHAIKTAENANKAKSIFLASMSHEIRTPLNGVIGAGDLILKTPLSTEQRSIVQIMQNSGYLLLHLIEDVLDISRIESGKLVADNMDFDLKSMIDGIVCMFEAQSKKKGLQIKINFLDETPYLLHGDAKHLRQILINLYGNAIKFTHKGYVEIRISVLTQDVESVSLRFEVIDSGIGISPESQKCIFENFTQANDSIAKKYGGTGLGAAISKRFVEFMGGEIGLHSVEGQGSVFWFSMSIKKQMRANAATKTEFDKKNAEVVFFDKKEKLNARILVAEDNPVNQIIILKALEQAGYSVDVAENGEMALDKLEINNYALAILDIQMPDISGVDVMKIFRAMNTSLYLPVIILTADATIEMRRECENTGADIFLTKPIDIDRLLDAVRSLAKKNDCASDIRCT